MTRTVLRARIFRKLILGIFVVLQTLVLIRGSASFAAEEGACVGDVEPPSQEVRIVAVGDIMMHMPLVKSAFRQETGEYSFGSIFSEVQPLIKEADVAVANLETTFANDQKFTGYPNFNSPKKLAADLKNIGFNLLVTANNHSLDYGESGVLRTLNVLSEAGLDAVGTYPDSNAGKPYIIEKKGIKIAVLAYTCLTNGHKVPAGKEYLLNIYSPSRVRDDLAKVKDQGADVVICYIHFGNEYVRYPSRSQKEIVGTLQEMGVDIVLGSHPHVVQPGAFSKTESKLAVYSLGNLISCQRSNYTDVGVVTEIIVSKRTGDLKASIVSSNYIPTYVVCKWENDRKTYKIRQAKNIDRYLTKKYSSKLLFDSGSFYSDFQYHVNFGLGKREEYSADKKAETKK